MDWSEERYVRLYTRDTGDMLAIGWQGRAVLAELMRKVDRAGILDESDPDILAELFRMPSDVCAEGLTKLGLRGVIEVRDGVIVIPNFIEAQEAKQSDRQRQSESRARRRDLARGETVTNRDTESQNETDGHADSEVVTACHSVLNRTVPSLAEPSPRARDPLLDFATAWRELTGRSEFAGFVAGSGPPSGTEAHALTQFRDACGGSVAEFRLRVTARLAGDRNGFHLTQTLVRWSGDLINAPAQAPAAARAPAAPYHAPMAPRAEPVEVCTYEDWKASQGPQVPS